MVGWWNTDVTVEPSAVAFPHAAMRTPAAKATPWLQPLRAALKTLRAQHAPAALRKGRAAAPRRVAPVWEDLSQQAGAGDEAGATRHLHLADIRLLQQQHDDGAGEDGGDGQQLIPPHFPGGGGLQFVGRWFIRSATEIDDEIIVCWVGPVSRFRPGEIQTSGSG